MIPDLIFPHKSSVPDEHDRDTGVSRGILAVHLDEPLLVRGIMVDFQGFKVKCRITHLKICNEGFQPFAVLTPVAIKINGTNGDIGGSEVSRGGIPR
jgi:hypothetical protein